MKLSQIDYQDKVSVLTMIKALLASYGIITMIQNSAGTPHKSQGIFRPNCHDK